MTDDMTALQAMVEPAMDEAVINRRRKIIHDALAAAVRLGMEQSVSIIETLVKSRTYHPFTVEMIEAICAAMPEEATGGR